MGWESLTDPNYNQVQGADFSFVDADTVVKEDGTKFRLRGINAPETFHTGAGYGTRDQEVGGQQTTEEIVKLANTLGYTKVVPTTDPKGQEVDQFGRQIGDLINPKTGRSFSWELARHGVVDPHKDFDPGNIQLESSEFQAALRTGTDYEESDWDRARNMIAQSVAEEQQYAQQFKQAQDYSGQLGLIDQAIEAEQDPFTRNLLEQRREQFNQFAGAALEYTDRHQVTGKSNNPLSTAWDTGLLGVAEAGYGIANLIGEKTGWEGASEYGEAGVYGIRQDIADNGSILLDYKDVDGFWSAVEYVTNNAAISVPYMGISIGGALLAPVTGGLSLAAPAAVYTGQTWNEMEGEKSASVAIGAGVLQAALDRVGLGFIAKTGAPKQVYNKAIAELIKRGATREGAEAQLANATRAQLAGFAGDAARVARNQLHAKEVFKAFAARAGTGAGGEAVTEGLQEATAYLGATLGSDKQFDWEELTERVIAGSVAGASLGGAFAVPGAAYETGAWADVAYRVAPAEAVHQSQSARYADEERDTLGYVPSIEQEIAGAKQRGQGQQGVTFEERVDADKAERKKRTAWEALTSTMLNAPALWRGATRNIFTPDLQAKSRSARILADMFGGNLQRIFSGSNFESSKHHRLAQYKNMVPIPDRFLAAWTGGKRLNRTQKGQVSDEIYTLLQAGIDPDTKQFNPDLIPDGPKKDAVVALQKQLESLSNKMWQDQKKHNPDLGYIDNYLSRYKSLSKKSIAADRIGFEQALRDKFGFSHADAKALTDEILDNSEVNDIDEAFSVVKGGIVPGSHRNRSLNLSELDEFQNFVEKDLFANVANAAKSAARYTAHRDYIGENAGVVAQLLNDMQNEGVDTKTVNRVAAQLQDYLDAESGNYKRPTSDAGKAAMRLQKNFMMLTTLAGLPLATISSFVEAALTMRGLTLDQITKKDGGLATLGKELADTVWKGATEIGDVAFANQRENQTQTAGKEKLRDLGFYEWDVGAATVTGVSETNPLQQQIYEQFFKWTGLQGWTNYTRAVRASMAADYIMDKINMISEQQLNGEVKTREVQQAEEALRNLGIDIDGVILATQKMNAGIPLTQEEQTILEGSFREGTFNFVNDAVALPQSANRPLIYQDPRFALFTQFQGFIATFTANHIPKLWGEYIKRGTPAMKYNAFAVMTSMIMLGFASQALKDLIKYGGKSPYLNDAEYLQRGVRSSGLLGTGERVLDQFFPLYEQRSDGVGSWVWNTTSGESPALSNLKRFGRATGKLLEGDVGEAARLGAKSTPGIGPFNIVTDLIGETASNWNFKG